MTTLKRLLTLFLVATISAFSAQVWGADDDVTLTWSAQGLSNGDVITGTSFSAGSYFTVTCTQGSAGTGPTYYDSGTGVRLYSAKSGTGNVVTVSRTSAGDAVSAYITGIEFNGSNKQGTTSFTYSGSPSASTSNTVTYLASSTVTSASGTLRETGGSKAGQYTFTNIKIYYTYTGSGCTNELTISASSTSHGTFDLDKTGAQKTCSGLVVTVTDIDPDDGYKFDHIEQSGVAAGNVTINNAAKTVTYAADVTGTSSITAVFSEVVSKTFELVTNASDLEEGAEIVMTNNGVTYAMGAQTSNNRSTTDDFTKNGTSTTVTVEEGSDVQILTLGKSNDHWTFYDSNLDGYLYAASSSSNYLRTQSSNDANGEWEISITDDVATIEAQGTNTNNLLKYNGSNFIFSCYGSGQQAVKIFQKSTGPTISTSGTLTTFNYNLGEGPSASQTFTVRGSNLTGNLTVTAPANYQVSLDGSSWAGSQTLTATAGKVNSTTIYVHLVAGLSVNTYNGNITISGGGATDKNVAVSGSVTIECTTPTLAFEGSVSSVDKVLGSGKYTIVATSPDNTLGATISYSSSNTDKATIDENTGEVTLVQATGSGSPVTITATLAAINTGVACQNEVTASYTLTIYNKVTWLVNDEEYTVGSPAPTTETLQGGQIAQLPSNPNGASVCGGKVFIGWTDHEVIDPVDVVPTPMYKKVSDMSSVYINSNKEFYAVFASASAGAGSGDYLLVDSDPGAANWAGDYLIAYDDETFADGRIGGTDAGGIGAQDVSVNPGTNLSGTTVDGTWGDTYNVTISKIGSTNTYLLQTKDGKYNYRTANNNGLDCSANATTADDYPLTIEFQSASDIEISVPAGPVFHYNPSGYFRFYKNSGQEAVYLYKKDGGGTTYSDYSTVCGTCLPAPTSPTVTPKSDRATITWTAVPDATGYTVTCTGGVTSVDGTTATITGLASETSYDFTIRSQGSDPYSCFPAYHGSFTTTACEDSPVLGIVTVTTTTATIPWTCEAATATIRVYEDAECNTQVGSDYTSCTSPYTVNTLTSNTTYYYKVWAGGTCVSAIGSFTTEEIKLDIAEWQTDAVVVSFNGDADLTLTTFTEETHGDPHANVADDIFFSKYFEAAASVKLIAIFNGTLNTVNLSNYKLGQAQAGKGTSETPAFSFTKFSDITKKSGEHLTADELELQSNEELILITYTAASEDDEIIACARDDEEHSKFSTYIRISSPELKFNGDDGIMLLNPDGDPIDLIGAGTKAGGLTRLGASFESFSSGYDHNGFMDQPGGWYTTEGYQANTDNTETFPYALSTNRCLLIRRKFVKSGHAAVALNATDFVTLSAYSYDADEDGTPEDYEGEWKGVQIPGSTTVYPYAAMSNSCTGFAVVGGYNYNDYYIDFEPVGGSTTFDDLKSSPFDGTYVIPVAELYDKACTMVRIELKDGSDNLVIRKDVKVPIMITGDKNTTDDIFHTHYKDATICRACDVVVLSGGTLTKAADGTTNDIDEVRDLKIYQGGKLIVPSETNYTVNTLAFRRQEDAVSSANIQGNITVNETDGVYFDMRVDPTNWHYFSLPYDCNVSDITFSTGDPATLGTDYLIKWYDGAKRAATQAGGCWEMVPAGATLKKGLGYIFALPGDGKVKKEFRLPMSNTIINQEKDPAGKDVSGIYAYGGDKSMTEVRANHRGWNLLGNPYLLSYTSDIADPIMTGYIVEDHSTDPWDGHYKFAEDSRSTLRYIVEPQDNGWSEYKQKAIIDYSMKPFTCYFVQVGGNPSDEQGVHFNLAKVNRSPVRRAPEEYEDVEDTHPVWCAVDLTNSKGEQDETTLLISNDFTDDYDIMNDLVKMRGDYYQYAQITTKPVLASRNNEGEMAFNALPDSSAVAGVPLNFFSAYSGSYTIAYNNKFDRDNEVKEVKLLDAKTNKWYDLMSAPYEFTSDRVNNTDRFVLSVRVERKQKQIATGLDDIGAYKGDKPRKVLLNGHVYIQRGSAIYDVTGKEVFNF